MMKHYVRQQVTNGNSYRTIDDYSAASIKEIVLHIMQIDFSKTYNTIKYDITSEKSNLLNKTQFYSTGLTYKQIKSLSEDDVEDLCLMITTDRNRTSLNYVRICPYLHKNPITTIKVKNSEERFNKLIKPIKLKIMQKQQLEHYRRLNSLKTSGFYIKPELATAYNLKQVIYQTKAQVYNHVKTTLINAGLNISMMDYNKIPKPIYDCMVQYSNYFSSDRKTSYHKTFDPFFRDYFTNVSHTHSGSLFTKDVNISPYLACHLALDITKLYDKQKIETAVNKLPHTVKRQLLYTSKKFYINNQYIDLKDIVNSHTYPAHITDQILKNHGITKRYHPLNVLKSGRILQKFYRSIVKPKLAAPPSAPAPELVKVDPDSEPSTPSTPASPTSSTEESEPPTPASTESSSESSENSETESEAESI